MKAEIAIKAIVNILPYLDSQEDLDEVVTFMTGFGSGDTGGESQVTLEELREEQGLDPNNPAYDPTGPEDGGHPY